MPRRGLQLSLTSLLALVACAAVNLWLFRVSALAGLIGLNISKHVIIAVLCQGVGVDRRPPPDGLPTQTIGESGRKP